jgi:transposase
MIPQLVNARKTKVMSGSINETDKLDVRGINRLPRSGTLPTVWIPPRELRDTRELPRTRMVLVRQPRRLQEGMPVEDMFDPDTRVLMSTAI